MTYTSATLSAVIVISVFVGRRLNFCLSLPC